MLPTIKQKQHTVAHPNMYVSVQIFGPIKYVPVHEQINTIICYVANQVDNALIL